MQIKNDYTAFCVDETSYYVYRKHLQRIKEKKELEQSMEKYSVRKRK